MTRMAHEIIERNQGLDGVALDRAPARRRVARRDARLRDRTDRARGPGRLDRRLPLSRRHRPAAGVARQRQRIDFEIDGAIVVLVDDVLFTGRTVKAALDAITDYGRPSAVQLAVLVDRGHRELPIRPDFVGKNLPTATTERSTPPPTGWSSPT